MHTRRLRLPIAGLAAAGVSTLALIGAGTAAAAPTTSVVAKDLNAPAHLAFGPGGHLYFAVSGTANPDDPTCITGVGPQDTPARFCAGSNGAVDEVLANGSVDDVFPRIIALQQTDTDAVTGVDAVTFRDGHLVVLSGDAEPDQTGDTPFASGSAYDFGVLRQQANGDVSYTKVVNGKRYTLYRPLADRFPGADISGYAASHPQSPATVGGPVGTTTYNSDPTDVVPYESGYAVTDAGADDVLLVSSSGHVSLAARLPTQPETAPANSLYPGSAAQAIDAQANPTALTVGPDGALYVAVSRDVPGLPGSAEIDRVVPGQAPTPVVTGLTNVSDLAFTKSGNLLILQANSGTPDTPGALLSATLDPTAPVTAENLGVSGLENASGLAISASGNVFISNDALGNGKGELLKVSGIAN